MKFIKGLSVGKKIGLGVLGFFILAAFVGDSNTAKNQELVAPATDSDQVSEIKITPEVEAEMIETKTITETEVIPFTSTRQNDPTLPSGTTKIVVLGVNGERTYTYEVTYTNGVESSREEMTNLITKQPVGEVVRVGTKKVQSNCDPNYTPCVPNVSYDLDCPDIGFSVTVVGYDRHGFDGNDNDGYGCESY